LPGADKAGKERTDLRLMSVLYSRTGKKNRAQPSGESREISERVVLDYDAQGSLIGIDIDNASKKVELNKLTLSKLPASEQIIAAYAFSTYFAYFL